MDGEESKGVITATWLESLDQKKKGGLRCALKGLLLLPFHLPIESFISHVLVPSPSWV